MKAQAHLLWNAHSGIFSGHKSILVTDPLQYTGKSFNFLNIIKKKTESVLLS